MKKVISIILLSIASISCADSDIIYRRGLPRYIPPLYEAVSRGDMKTVKQFILDNNNKSESSEGRRGTIKKTLLFAKSLSMAQFLLSEGAEITAIDDHYKRTPLHKAHNVEIAKFLIENGADVHARDESTRAPSTYARRSGNQKLAKFLDAETEKQKPKPATHPSSR